MNRADTEVSPPADGSAAAGHIGRGLRGLSYPLVAYLLVGLSLFVLVWAAPTIFGINPLYPVDPSFPGSDVLGGWFRFDGGWYELIARNGYFYAGEDAQSSIAFFPAYPLLMRLVAVVVRNEVIAGMLITFACGLAATLLLYRWVERKLDAATARLAVLVFVLYPYAWYLFGAVYADALFIAGVIAAFVLVENDHPILAGLVAAVATAARPVGVAVVIGLVAVVIHRRGGWRRLRPADLGVLLSACGLLAWAVYLWSEWDDPLLFAEVQEAPGWDQGSGPRTWLKFAFFERLPRLPFWLSDVLSGSTEHNAQPGIESSYTLGLVLQGTMLLAGLALAVVVWRRLGWGYGSYCLLVLGIPLLGTKDFQGAGRYVLAAFPCFAVAAQLLAERRIVRLTWLPVSAVLLALLATAYARGYYVA